jgi:hypothetical protein
MSSDGGVENKAVKPPAKAPPPLKPPPAPDTAAAKASPPGGNGAAARAQLKPDFEKQHDDNYLAGYTIGGISIRLSIAATERPTVEANLVGITGAIKEANAAISDPRFHVRLCAIVDTTTRFTTYRQQPILTLAPRDANPGVARHELGHATFDYLRKIQRTRSPLHSTALQIADIYARLAATKPVRATKKTRDVDTGKDTSVEMTFAAGLWIADPPQWSNEPGIRSEHPWSDADELFASAREAFFTNRQGLEASIARFADHDPAVRAPAHELVAVLDALSRGKPPPPSKHASSKEAKDALSRTSFASPAEDSLAINTMLLWALEPSTWPWDKP